ncbi:MAG: hypothetical protein KatS3mg090_0205 [Patescibacteria group bacterium]|nr:MAG: hypothetical protein KatS3mg090_0205 [Patescibacteria group bacterium]
MDLNKYRHTPLDRSLYLMSKVMQADLPEELENKALEMIKTAKDSLKYGNNMFLTELTEKYINWIVQLPWFSEDKTDLDIKKAEQILEKNHYGLKDLKRQILEFISIQIIRKEKNLGPYTGPTLFLVGLAGTGKTTFAKSIAEALGRKFLRIPFGGLSSVLELRGEAKIKPEAEPGKIIKLLAQAKTKNPVILLDELDRVTDSVRDAVMGVLLELLDPEQNSNFRDNYIDYPFDLSNVLFIATANNTNNISTAVLDRMEVVRMPSYTDEEKTVIAKIYIFPKVLKEVGLTSEDIKIDDNLWPKLVRPLGFDPGIRSLARNIRSIVRSAALKIVKGEYKSILITEKNYKEYIK